MGNRVSNTRITNQSTKKKGGLGGIIFTIIMISIMTDAATGLLPMIAVLCTLGIPFAIAWSVIKKVIDTGKRNQSPEYQEVRQKYSDFELTKSTSKREKFITKFNKKYNLNLTDEQIERILNASYVSYYWEREVYDMSRDYAVDIEWYKSDTDWLRAYLRAFPIMDISSDFNSQRMIVLQTFDRIFTELDKTDYYSVEEAINSINNRFMINFDEMTFMIAYKFLKQNGKKHRLPSMGFLGGETEIERLAHSYDNISEQELKESYDKIKKSNNSELDDLMARYSNGDYYQDLDNNNGTPLAR